MSEEDIVDGYVQDVEYGQYAMCMVNAYLYVFPKQRGEVEPNSCLLGPLSFTISQPLWKCIYFHKYYCVYSSFRWEAPIQYLILPLSAVSSFPFSLCHNFHQ